MGSRNLMVLGLAMIVLGCPTRVSAALVLSFDRSSYGIGQVGETVPVQVFLSQTPDGPQVGVGNELLTAGVLVSFSNPAGIAEVTAPANIVGGPAFDSFSAGVDPAMHTASLAELSLLGIGDLSSPLLLGTFTFTGLNYGTTTISVADLDVSADFITAMGDVLDPTNTPTAQVVVIPEACSFIVWSLLAAIGITSGWWLGRRKGT